VRHNLDVFGRREPGTTMLAMALIADLLVVDGGEELEKGGRPHRPVEVHVQLYNMRAVDQATRRKEFHTTGRKDDHRELIRCRIVAGMHRSL